MVLLAFTVGVIQIDHFVVSTAEVRPKRIDLNIRREQELAVLVDCALDDLVNDQNADGLFLSTDGFIRKIFPATSNIHCFPFAGIAYILAAVLDFFLPFVLLFSSAEITLDDKPGTVFDQDAQVFCGIISGIHADKQWLSSQLMRQGEGLS